MLKVLQSLVGSPVVRGDDVIGYIDKIEIEEGGVYIVLETLPGTGGDGNPVREQIARIGS